MGSNENLQYALLALVNGLEAYTKRTNQVQDFQAKQQLANQQWQQRQDYESPYRKLQMEHMQAETDAARSLIQQRQQGSTNRYGDYGIELSKMSDQVAWPVYGQIQEAMKANNNDPEAAINYLRGRSANINQEIPDPQPDPNSMSPVVPDSLKKQVLTQRVNRQRIYDIAVGAMQHHHLSQPVPAPGAAEGASATTGPGPAPAAAEQSTGPFGSMFNSLRAMQGMVGGQQGPATSGGPAPAALQGNGIGGAMVTPPRVPTADITHQQAAEMNYQAFSKAPQGPLANAQDQHHAGELAKLWTILRPNSGASFMEQAAAWFRLHDLDGRIVVPDVFQQWATGRGIPRSVIDSYRPVNTTQMGVDYGDVLSEATKDRSRK